MRRRRASAVSRPESLARLAALREIDWDTQLQDTSGDTSALSFFSGVCFGLLVGVIVALLLAPAGGQHRRPA
jgi:hypothetical protein